MQVYAELDAFLPYHLDIDVVQATCIPNGMRVQTILLLQRVNVPELDREPTGRVFRPSRLWVGRTPS